MRIIAIHGKARSGKDELAKILCMSYGFKKIAFANKLKEFAIKYFQLRPEVLYENKTKESRHIMQALGASVRNHTFFVEEQMPLNIIGVSGYPNWVEEIAQVRFEIEPTMLKKKKKSIKNILDGIHNMYTEKLNEFIMFSNGYQEEIWINYLYDKIKDDDSVHVISDLRFKNEKRFVENMNGKCVKILRVDGPGLETGKPNVAEYGLDTDLNWDEIIVNYHKEDWRNSLSLSASNLIRKLKNEEYFKEEDLKKFKISIDEYK